MRNAAICIQLLVSRENAKTKKSWYFQLVEGKRNFSKTDREINKSVLEVRAKDASFLSEMKMFVKTLDCFCFRSSLFKIGYL